MLNYAWVLSKQYFMYKLPPISDKIFAILISYLETILFRNEFVISVVIYQLMNIK